MRAAILAQGRLLLLAVQLLTRIPVRTGPPAPGDVARALRWAPLVGAAVGAAGAAVLALPLPPWPGAIAAVAAMALLTGALHEDGLADTLDGLGGGRSGEHALEIMKDSRIGTYGALGLGLVTLGRVAALAELPAAAVVGAGALSRGAMLLLPSLLPPARRGGAGGLVAGGPGAVGWAVAAATVLLAWAGQPRLPAALLVCGVAALLFARHIRRRLGGYTGDTLGALQQGTELLAYGVLLWDAG